MALHLSSPVTDVQGLGSIAGKDLKNLGIISVRDLLLYFPYRYDDFSHTAPIGSLRHDDTVTITGRIRTIASRPSKNRRVTLTEAVVEDGSGSIKVTWFNQPYLEKTLSAGRTISLAGRVDARFGLTLMNPVHEPAGTHLHTGRIVPVYGLSGSLTMRRLRSAMKASLAAAVEFEEWLPEVVVKGEGFPSLAAAIESVHFPESAALLVHAVGRLKFDELFLHQLLFAHVRERQQTRPAVPIPVDEAYVRTFVNGLPFVLTDGQQKAVRDVLDDCARSRPMNRLLQGDVGSGKTAVAAAAMAHALHAGMNTAYLAPTEILAVQQHAALGRFITHEPIGLLTGSQAKIGGTDVAREAFFDALNQGSLRCLVGTHALLQEGVLLPPFGFLVVDEQHRFGVEQRHALLERGAVAPHLLSMTATPIPRSLALTIYGDLDASVLNERPAGRQPIATELVEEKDKTRMWTHVLKEIRAGHRVYIVCPLIDPSDRSGTLSVSSVAKSLNKGVFKEIRVGMLHGKMKADEKTDTIARFRDGALDLLVSTTVVEVGVDVPQATVMIIVGAERFGLAQLHQLRGRVGRSDLASRCFLVPDQLTEVARERLSAVVGSSDGFALAEKDLELRGPGNVFGNAQSGFPDFKLATSADVPIMKNARDWASRVLKDDPHLEHHHTLRTRVHDAFNQVHLE